MAEMIDLTRFNIVRTYQSMCSDCGGRVILLIDGSPPDGTCYWCCPRCDKISKSGPNNTGGVIREGDKSVARHDDRKPDEYEEELQRFLDRIED